MKKVINESKNILNEMIGGMIKAFPEKITQLNDLPIILRKNKKIGKVGLLSGGGSGHEPSHAGYVGMGMLDVAVAGEIFSSPSADKVYEGIKAANSGAGVLLIIKNYSGDIMNFEMAAEMAEMENILVKKVIVDDDIAVDNSTYTVGKRGIAGTVFVHKILGAAAEKGYTLDELEKLGEKVVENLKTMGISLEPCTNLSSGIKSFDLADDEVEIGLGIHGEPGTHREKKQNADQYVNILMKKILAESKINNEKIAVLINGLGNTILLELFIVNNRVADILAEKKIAVSETMVGNYMTAIDMSGFSISILKLDDEMEKLLKCEADTIALTRK